MKKEEEGRGRGRSLGPWDATATGVRRRRANGGGGRDTNPAKVEPECRRRRTSTPSQRPDRRRRCSSATCTASTHHGYASSLRRPCHPQPEPVGLRSVALHLALCCQREPRAADEPAVVGPRTRHSSSAGTSPSPSPCPCSLAPPRNGYAGARERHGRIATTVNRELARVRTHMPVHTRELAKGRAFGSL